MSDTRPGADLDRYRIGTFTDIMYRNALLYADKEAFILGPQRVTFREYNERANRLVRAVSALGIVKGETLGVVSWNSIQVVDSYGAAMKGGFIVCPFNARLSDEELVHVINDSATRVLIVGLGLEDSIRRIRERLETVEHLVSCAPGVEGMVHYDDFVAGHSGDEPDVDIDEDDPFLIIYTSGTTGAPKGALYTHRRKMEDAKLWALNLTIEPHDRALCIQPLFHIAATVILAFMYVGATHIVSVDRTFDPEVTVGTIEREGITFLQIVPTMLVALLEAADRTHPDLSSLTRILYAASPMPVGLLRRGLEEFGPIFIQSYGQSESGPNITSFPRYEHQVLDLPPERQRVLASAGRPCIGVQVRIVDEEGRELPVGELGEITVRSKSLMVGYWRKPEETAKTIVDGWLRTGDVGRLDEEGYLYLVDRQKDMIVTGGENVYPYEVEAVLHQHSVVRDVAVIALPDPYWVERVHAVIVKEPNVETPDDAALTEELRAFCRQSLAGFKVPKSMEFVQELPRNAGGKILRRVLRDERA